MSHTGTPYQPPLEEAPKEGCQAKIPFEEPRLAFIEPRLIKHGDATQITQQSENGFFGTFVP
jgi:hypothetical protein